MIRLVEESDVEAIHEIYSPYVMDTSITFEQSPPSVAEIRGRIRKKGKRHPWLVCRIKTKLSDTRMQARFGTEMPIIGR
jgi:phosphinothricin acetyltransferase